MISLLAAFQFLTILPLQMRRTLAPQELGRAAGWYPLVGLALGAGLFGLRLGAGRFLPAAVAAIAVLIAWIALTGALHFDGLIDTCDGVFGGWTPERRLEIMRDSRAGAFGVAGGGLLLLTKYAALTDLPAGSMALLFAPVLGRWAMVLAMFAFPYARELGLGRDVKDNVRRSHVALASGITVASVFLAGWLGFAALVVTVAAVLLISAFLLRRLPGLTGDSYGALCEVVEALVLIFFAVRWT